MVQLVLVSVISLAIAGVLGAPIPHARRGDDDNAPPADGAQAPMSAPGSKDGGGSAWKQQRKYTGKDFLDAKQWEYFTGRDPTNGLVSYQDHDAAMKQGLATVGDDGVAVLAVDDKTQLKAGDHRNSVRITSTDKYDGGLFIVDLAAMPHGCSVWPAWWSVGPNWPAGGEIDILEGVHDDTGNQYTLHTSEGCSLANGAAATSKVLGNTCASGAGHNSGCAYKDSDARTYGKGFNAAGGGVYAHQWDDDGIKVWFFSRSDIPKDITSGSPNPKSWSKPAANFMSTTCDMKKHFYQHQLVFDITLCGDWAGASYASSGCPGTCEQRVADPANFKDAKFRINYVAVYQSK